MPTKEAANGRKYEIDGKKFKWFPLDDDDLPTSEPVVIPLRIKLKIVRQLAADQEMDVSAMFSLLEAIIPNQSEVLDEMDLNDFEVMFATWQREYETLSGATLGESEGSSK